jgi:hypothetical protein
VKENKPTLSFIEIIKQKKYKKEVARVGFS